MKKTTRLKRTSIVLVAALLALASFQFMGSGCTAGGRVVLYFQGNGNTGGTDPDRIITRTPGSATLRGHGSLVRTGFRFGGWRNDNTRSVYPTGFVVNWPQRVEGHSIRLNATWVSTGAHRNTRYHLGSWFPLAVIDLRSGVVITDNTINRSVWLSAMSTGTHNWNSNTANIAFDTRSNSSNTVTVAAHPHDLFHLGWVLPRNVSGTQRNNFDIVLNTTAVTFWSSSTGVSQASIVTCTMAHELGHTIGLRDNPTGASESTSIMNDWGTSTPIRPTQFDINNVNLLYR